jgi:hypothetical protein
MRVPSEALSDPRWVFSHDDLTVGRAHFSQDLSIRWTRSSKLPIVHARPFRAIKLCGC